MGSIMKMDSYVVTKNYESAGCNFAPIEVAAEFSHETMVAENYGNIPFGFHGKNNYYYQVTQKSL